MTFQRTQRFCLGLCLQVIRNSFVFFFLIKHCAKYFLLCFLFSSLAADFFLCFPKFTVAVSLVLNSPLSNTLNCAILLGPVWKRHPSQNLVGFSKVKRFWQKTTNMTE